MNTTPDNRRHFRDTTEHNKENLPEWFQIQMEPIWALIPDPPLPPRIYRVPNTPTARAQAASLDVLAAEILANRIARLARTRPDPPRAATLPSARPRERAGVTSFFVEGAPRIPPDRVVGRASLQPRFATLPPARARERPGVATFFGMEIYIDPPEPERVPRARMRTEYLAPGRPRSASYPQWQDRQVVPGAAADISRRPTRTPFLPLQSGQLRARTRRRAESYSTPPWQSRGQAVRDTDTYNVPLKLKSIVGRANCCPSRPPPRRPRPSRPGSVPLSVADHFAGCHALCQQYQEVVTSQSLYSCKLSFSCVLV